MDRLTIISLVTNLLSVLTIIGGIIIIIGFILLLMNKKKVFFSGLQTWVNNHAFILAFIVSAFALFGSLFFSDYAFYEPCRLCWYQRIFIYPIFFILLVSFILKDKFIHPYIFTFAGIGGLIAFYHYLLQLGLVTAVSCDIVGYSASCSERFVLRYGYITIPMMALTACLLIILFLFSHYKDQKLKKQKGQ